MTIFPLKLGSQGSEVVQLAASAVKRYKGYALEADGSPLKADGYYGRGEQRFATTWQGRMGRPITGKITEGEFNFIVHGTPFPAKDGPEYWAYSMPGSGADYTQGPSFEWGVFCEEHLGMHHQPVKHAKGGYIGLMGGAPSFSYVDVTYDQYMSIKWLWDNNPKIQQALKLATEGKLAEAKKIIRIVMSAYSQTADGLEDALEILCGDGGFVIPKTGEVCGPGKYRAIRDLIVGVYNFGNPSRQPGAMSGIAGYNPTGWGIARKKRPAWLGKIVVSVTVDGDFYASVPDSDTIRPPFYAIIVKSALSTPFFARVLKIAVEAIPKLMPFVVLTGPFAPLVLAGLTGLTGLLGVLTPLMGMFGSGQPELPGDLAVDAELEELLSAQGILSNIPALFALVGALNGINLHGQYQGVQHPAFGGRTGVEVAIDATRHDMALAA